MRPDFCYNLRGGEYTSAKLRPPHLEIVTGVMEHHYPHRISHSYQAHLAGQPGATLHFDHIRAVNRSTALPAGIRVRFPKPRSQPTISTYKEESMAGKQNDKKKPKNLDELRRLIAKDKNPGGELEAENTFDAEIIRVDPKGVDDAPLFQDDLPLNTSTIDADINRRAVMDDIDDYTDDEEILQDFSERQGLLNSGSSDLLERLEEHHSKSPHLSGGDIDARWEDADVSGEESVGSTVSTPDQDVVDELGRAAGLEYGDLEPLQTEDKLIARDLDRWELNPLSRDDNLNDIPDIEEEDPEEEELVDYLEEIEEETEEELEDLDALDELDEDEDELDDLFDDDDELDDFLDELDEDEDY